MLEGLFAALKGADPFAAVHGVSEDEARRLLREQWSHLDRLAADDPGGYRRFLEEAAAGAGVALPPAMAEAAAAAVAPADAPEPVWPSLVVRAAIRQPEGVVAPAAPKEMVVYLYKHTAGRLPPVLLAGGRPVRAPAAAAGAARQGASGERGGRGGGTADEEASSDEEWCGAVVRFVEHRPAVVEPPSRSRPAVALHYLECDEAALACAVLARPEAARRAVVIGAIRAVERRLGVAADYGSIDLRVRPFGGGLSVGGGQRRD
ncbi:MAG: hypothetical protein J3K34DRAFT_449791 [Monoraphidium minutum]|nr:MAG: hypothetical protein J3K34DRAFT_449791 [Monoraphidium minutum]